MVGLHLRRDLPCWKAGVALLARLGVINRDGVLRPLDPTRFADRPD